MLHLHKESRLESLACAASMHAPTHLQWRVVRAHLRRHWPAKMEALIGPDEGVRREARKECCPITHQPLVDAVVASDGHTYERDALLEHMARNGALSPMTREPLEYHLYPNRALRELLFFGRR